MAQSLETVEFDAILEQAKGHAISGGEVTHDGLHFTLDDGKTIIISGEFVIAIYRVEPATLQ